MHTGEEKYSSGLPQVQVEWANALDHARKASDRASDRERAELMREATQTRVTDDD